MATDEKRPSGTHARVELRAVKTDNIPTIRDADAGGTVEVQRQGNDDIDLLPRRFDFFAAEVRDFMGNVKAFLVPKIARLEDEVIEERRYSISQWKSLNQRVDALDEKLDKILQAVAASKAG